MTLWLANLVAYSLQLAMLVATAALMASLLRLYAPLAALRFWQGIFLLSVLWPTYQLWPQADSASMSSSTALLMRVAAWSSSTFAAEPNASGRFAAFALGAIGLGISFRLTCIVAGLLKLRALRAASTPASSLASIAEPLQKELGIAADVQFTDGVASPATFGARRPTVLLPWHVNTLTPAVQQAILCHELLHVRRRDWLAALIEEIWCALLWFHPAARVLAAQLGLARETLVDQATIAHTADRRAYAAALLEFSTADRRLVGAAAFTDRRGLGRRIALITEEFRMHRMALVVRLSAATLAVTVAVLVMTTTVRMNAVSWSQADKVYQAGKESGVTLPEVIKEVKPAYTARAMQAKIQGAVHLTAVVLPSGEVGAVTVARSLDKEYGLDDQAIEALRQWKFKPGTKAGKPVPVEVTVEMTFTLKK